MKNIFLVVILFCLQLKSQTPPNSINLSNLAPYTNGFYNYDFSPTVLTMQKIRLNAKEEIISATEVKLLPDFEAINFNNGGFHAEISTSYLEPVSFHPNGWSNIGLYEKFEVGVKLPPNILAQIESFLNGGPGINPYDPSQISVKAIFFTVNGPSFYAERFGFYYRDITLSGSSSYSQAQSEYPFRIRFAPPLMAFINVKFELYVNNNLIDEFHSCGFNVVDNGHIGFLSLNNAHKLKDSRGGSVFAAGQAMGYVENGSNNFATDNTAFDKQRDYITDLAANSGNLARLRLDPGSYEIEWNDQIGVYGSNRMPNSNNFLRQYHAYQLDKTFDLCDSKGVYVFLTLMQDQTLTSSPAYCCGSEWPISPYSQVVNSPDQFLFNSVAKNYFKNKLSYIIARWGYSANLAMYSLMNEANGVSDYNNSSITKANMETWHCEMSSYLKFRYPRHLVTTGYNQDGTSESAVTNKEDNSFACPNIDIASCNHYSTSKDLHKERHDEIPKRVSYNSNKQIHTLMKPFIFGELGMTDCNPASDRYTDAEFHNSIWSTSMYDHAIGNGLYWYDWNQVNGIPHRENFKALANFFNDWTIGTNEFKSNWSFSGSLAKLNRKIEYIEAVSLDRKKGYGWVKNSDYFWANDPYRLTNWPVPLTAGSCNTSFPVTYNYPSHNGFILLHGLIPNQFYDIDIWSCYGNGGLVTNLSNQFSGILGIVGFHRIVETDPSILNGPDFAYKVHRSNTSFRTSDNLTNYTDTIYLNADSPCFETEVYIEDAAIGSHLWNFGNGQTSNEENTTVCYKKEGLYSVSHEFKDSTNTLTKQTQNLYVILLSDKSDERFTETNNNLILYPNPTTNSIFIKSDENILNIFIYNQIGELISKLENINDTELELKDTKLFKPGAYVVKVLYGNNHYDFRKFIKI